jgi:hypothetical protein
MLQPPNDGRPAVPGQATDAQVTHNPTGGATPLAGDQATPGASVGARRRSQAPNGAPVRHIPRSAGRVAGRLPGGSHRARRRPWWPGTPPLVARSPTVSASDARPAAAPHASQLSATHRCCLATAAGRAEGTGPPFHAGGTASRAPRNHQRGGPAGSTDQTDGRRGLARPAFSLPGSARTVASVRERTRRAGPLGSAPRSARALAWPCRPTSASTSGGVAGGRPRAPEGT